jgi:ribose-phosphate pyrophosphokinase
MRGVKIFSGRSHPSLAEAICERLGTSPAKCDLGNFSNGEISVQIGTSIRNQDVFIVQSGSPKINDSVMELLIMIGACKGGSAKSITAVMPYFPYSRQSKKKSHRGAITARMVANLMSVAGVDHVITVDLHASQMQGFFGKPVDNLFAEPLIARWIMGNVRGWREAVVVSKNAGGTKRVTSLADALKLSFAIVSTDKVRNRQRTDGMGSSVFFDSLEPQSMRTIHAEPDDGAENGSDPGAAPRWQLSGQCREQVNGIPLPHNPRTVGMPLRSMSSVPTPSPRLQNTPVDSMTQPPSPYGLNRTNTEPSARRPSECECAEGYNDERAREVITSRLIHGHIVDDDYPSPALSGMSVSMGALPGDRNVQDAMDNAAHDPMTSSFVSTVSSFQPDHALGGTLDAAATSDEEEEGIQNPELEHTITLVGHVRDKIVFLVDDMIDKSGSWIAAAETVAKKGGAKRVYCIATHGLLGDDSLEEMEMCDCIDFIVITNSFPISPHRLKESKKLVVIDLSNLLSEAIRRNHHGGKFLTPSARSRTTLTGFREHFCTFPAALLSSRRVLDRSWALGDMATVRLRALAPLKHARPGGHCGHCNFGP